MQKKSIYVPRAEPSRRIGAKRRKCPGNGDRRRPMQILCGFPMMLGLFMGRIMNRGPSRHGNIRAEKSPGFFYQAAPLAACGAADIRPGENGPDWCRHLRAKQAGLPIRRCRAIPHRLERASAFSPPAFPVRRQSAAIPTWRQKSDHDKKPRA